MRGSVPLLLLVGCAALGPPVPDPTALRLVADGFTFTEGPTADGRGNVWFTDQPNDRILLKRPDGTVTTWLEPCGRSNGLWHDGDRLLACADERNQLWAIDLESRAARVLVEGFAGALLNGPNDLWVDPGGGIWFTDPFYRRPYWERAQREQDGEHVYHLAPDGRLTRAATGFQRPNGIIGRADGTTLYVADLGAGRTWAFPIEGPGRLGQRRLVFEQGSDGMALDDEGHLYLTGDGVTVVEAATGRLVQHVPVPGTWTANVTFDGGKLFLTARGAVYELETRVRDGSR